jgi:hypothetical protein
MGVRAKRVIVRNEVTKADAPPPPHKPKQKPPEVEGREVVLDFSDVRSVEVHLPGGVSVSVDLKKLLGALKVSGVEKPRTIVVAPGMRLRLV